MLQSLTTKARQVKSSGKNSTSTHRGSWARRRRLGLENLEDRVVPTIGFIPIFGGESVISGQGTAYTYASINLIFLNGSSSGIWNSTNENTFTTDVQTILDSDYLDGIAQYTYNGGYGPTDQITDQLYSTSTDPVTLTNSTGYLPVNYAATGTNAFGWDYFDTIPKALKLTTDLGPNPIFFFITDPAIGTGITPSPLELNDESSATNFNNYVWLQAPETSGSINFTELTTLFTQGLVDQQTQGSADTPFAVSLPPAASQYSIGNLNNGVYTGGTFQAGNGTTVANGPASIGDGEPSMMPYTDQITENGNTVTVQAYWSQVDQAFIIPDPVETLTWTYPTANTETYAGNLGNFELLDNGVLNEKTTGGDWRQILTGVQTLAQGPAGGAWANDVFALEADGSLLMTTITSGIFTDYGTGITQFAFGNAGTSFANVIWALSGTNLEYDKGSGFVVFKTNVNSFQIGQSGTIFAKDIFDLSNGVLAYDQGNGFINFDSSVVSFAFGNAGTPFANELIDLHVDGNLNESYGHGLFQIDHYVSSFAFGDPGSAYAGYLFALHDVASSGNDESGLLTYADSVNATTYVPNLTFLSGAVSQFAVGNPGTSWDNTLFVDADDEMVQFNSGSFSSPAATYGGVSDFAFGYTGNGGGNDVFYAYEEFSPTFGDSQIPGSSGPGAGYIPIYPNTATYYYPVKDLVGDAQKPGLWYGYIYFPND